MQFIGSCLFLREKQQILRCFDSWSIAAETNLKAMKTTVSKNIQKRRGCPFCILNISRIPMPKVISISGTNYLQNVYNGIQIVVQSTFVTEEMIILQTSRATSSPKLNSTIPMYLVKKEKLTQEQQQTISTNRLKHSLSDFSDLVYQSVLTTSYRVIIIIMIPMQQASMPPKGMVKTPVGRKLDRMLQTDSGNTSKRENAHIFCPKMPESRKQRIPATCTSVTPTCPTLVNSIPVLYSFQLAIQNAEYPAKNSINAQVSFS